MYLVAIAWMYVVLMMAAVEASSPNGTVLGAFFTLIFYGVLPVALVLYVLRSPARKRARKAAEANAVEQTAPPSGSAPDDGGHAPGEAISTERKEP